MEIVIEGQPVPVRVRRNARARRLILRMDGDGPGVVVTLPPHAPDAEALGLARRKSAWIAGQMGSRLPPVPFEDGALVPHLGRMRRVRHAPEGRGNARLEGDEIVVAGRPEHLERRLGDWFRTEARRELSARADRHCAALGVKRGRITVRDTRSRWGSCSAKGGLSFSWRLVMAPERILDYVAAHEVAHLRHHDHGPDFWRAVRGLVGDADWARAWLREWGKDLHRYGKMKVWG